MATSYSKLIAQDRTHAQWMADPSILAKGQLIITVDGYIRIGDGNSGYAGAPQLLPVVLPDAALVPKGVVTFTADATAEIAYRAGNIATVEAISAGKWRVTFTTERSDTIYPIAYGFAPPDGASYDRIPVTVNATTASFEIHTRDITSDGFYDGGVVTAIVY